MAIFTSASQKLWALIQGAITHLDNEAFHHLSAYQNKSICFQIEHFPPLYFQVQSNRLNIIETSPPSQPDVVFQGPLSAFIQMIFQKRQVKQNLQIKGDLDCAKALYDAWQSLDLDWESALAEWLGYPMAHGLFQVFSKCHHWTKKLVAARIHDLGAYLQDEKGWLPTKEEIDSLLSDVDLLRDDVERFEAKLRRVQQHLSHH